MKLYNLLLTILVSIACLLPRTTDTVALLSVFSKAMTGIHWGILLLPALGQASNHIIRSNKLKEYPNASPELTNFIKEELQKNGCSQEIIDNIQIKIGQKFQAGYILDGKHIITVPAYVENYTNLSVDNRNAVIFLTRHEAAHLEHKDMWRNIIVALVAPFAAHALVSAMLLPFTYALSSYTPEIIQSLLQIPSAILKVSIAGAFVLIWSKYKEHQADKKASSSIQDKAVLEHMKSVCLTVYENYERNHKLNPAERETLSRFVYDETHTPDFSHPNYLLRAKVLDNAINNLSTEKEPGIA